MKNIFKNIKLNNKYGLLVAFVLFVLMLILIIIFILTGLNKKEQAQAGNGLNSTSYPISSSSSYSVEVNTTTIQKTQTNNATQLSPQPTPQPVPQPNPVPPAAPASINCYSCTDSLNDADACKVASVVHANADGSFTCPSGTTSVSNGCGSIGGYGSELQRRCPTTEDLITCYKCTDSLYDGNACEVGTVILSNPNGSFTCPSGTTYENTTCQNATYTGMCPVYEPVSY